MRLITLNTWGGKSLYPLMHFLKREAETTDVFCLQEMFRADQATVDELHPGEYICADLFQKIGAELPEFQGFFADMEGHPEHLSMAMFVKKSVQLLQAGDTLLFDARNHKPGSFVNSPRTIQHAVIGTPGGPVMIVNFHGIYTGGSKKDTPERFTQAKLVNAYLQKFDGRRILCGDFNLLPDTESFRMLAEGMRDLVAEHGVERTRTPLYRHYNDESEPNFADYILTTPDVEVSEFAVLPDIVSDHSPLVVEFE